MECVPNFSEGRRGAVVADITAAICSVPAVRLLDVSTDPDHNRAVVAFAGPPDEVVEAAVRAVAMASDLIDMEQHRGAHPRMGAADVVPFVPVADVTMAECVALAREAGRRIGGELGIPVYLYGEAATRPERRRVADVRRGEYEGLKQEIERNPLRRPDFGPSRMGRAGATAVGARLPLIAYNVNLATTDLALAKEIARLVRESSGGLPAVQALGFALPARAIVQVSMNLIDYRRTPPQVVLAVVRREAERRGVAVAGAELVGIVPADLLAVVARDALALDQLDPDQILEYRWLREV